MSKTTTFPDGLGRSQIATHMAFMALNWLGCVVACVLLGRAHGYSLRAAYLYINLQGHFGVLLLAFVLAFLDRASLAIAAMQLKQISGLASPKVLLTQLLVGAFFFILAAIVSMATLHLVIEPRYYRPIPVWPGGLVWLTLSRVPELVSALPSRPSGYLLLLTAFGTLASLPIAIYGCALVAVLALRARWISWITQRTLRQISKDKAPVVSLVGNFLAGLAAIVALLTGHSK